MSGDVLWTAVRAFTERAPDKRRRSRRSRVVKLPTVALVFDTETTMDGSQRLTFGSYRYLRRDESGRYACVEEGLIYADDLPLRDPAGFAALEAYARAHRADVGPGVPTRLQLRSRRDFAERVLYRVAYKARGLVVGFNLLFDLSRVAVGWGDARGAYYGGVSLKLWGWERSPGDVREHRFRPRITFKAIDSKRALISFTRPTGLDAEDQIPEDSEDGLPDRSYTFRGNFLDLRTLAFALTNRSHSLASACEAFGVEHGKLSGMEHGTISPEYIDYNRRDVLATVELLEKLLAELERHPIELPPTKALSPASIGKAYLHAMGIQPILERQPDFPRQVLGYAMSGFIGGRAEDRIRLTSVPVVYLDVLSMYPTVNALMGLWDFLIAERIDMVDDTDGVQRFLESVTLDACFRPETWRRFPVLVEVEPDGDILPVRARYDGEAASWQIGVNPFACDGSRWYGLADIVASKLLAGEVPKIARALRLVPVGRVEGLQPVQLRGTVGVDPAGRDFFLSIIEERKRVAARADLSPEERKRLDAFLKVLANATSYGIFAQMDRHELPKDDREAVTVHGQGGSFEATVSAPEEAGEYCFPPVAACITSAARLILAMLERAATDSGGSYGMCDTDSMAIVATEHGGLVACEGGSERLPDGRPAIRALSRSDVQKIRARFEALTPYDLEAAAGSILKLEDVNLDAETGGHRQLWMWGISAKRYALFNVDDEGQPILRKWSEHGLGHLLNPTDPQSEDRDWIRQLWEYIVRVDALGLETPEPTWLDRPAVSRVTASGAELLRPFKELNRDKPYADRVKPMNFLLSAHIAPLGHPDGVDPQHFHLVAPYTPDARQWTKLKWLDIYSGRSFRITTRDGVQGPNTVRVKTYRDVLEDYRWHSESKFDGPNGVPAGRATRGLLQRRRVRAHRGMTVCVGKESNRIEDVEVGLVHDEDEVLSTYTNPERAFWHEIVLPWMRTRTKRELAEWTGLSGRQIAAIRNGHAKLRPRHLRALARAAPKSVMCSSDAPRDQTTTWPITHP